MSSGNNYIVAVSAASRDHAAPSYTRGIKAALILVCAVIGVGVALNTLLYAYDMYSLLTAQEGNYDALRYLVISGISGALDIVLLVSFLSFALSIIKSNTLFSKKQTLRLLIIAVCLLSEVLLNLFLPTYEIASTAAEAARMVSPTLDLRLLSFSLVFFALAGIFEYGRMLKEDAENVL